MTQIFNYWHTTKILTLTFSPQYDLLICVGSISQEEKMHHNFSQTLCQKLLHISIPTNPWCRYYCLYFINAKTETEDNTRLGTHTSPHLKVVYSSLTQSIGYLAWAQDASCQDASPSSKMSTALLDSDNTRQNSKELQFIQGNRKVQH